MIYLHKYHAGEWRGSLRFRKFASAERTEMELLRAHGHRGWGYELSTSPQNPREGDHDHNDGRSTTDAAGATPSRSDRAIAVNPA